MKRVNEIIAVATQGLVEVCQIVEKCRPGAHNGKIPFKNRVAWVMFDSKEFKAHEPVISRHHSSVLSELNFLRHSALLAAHTGEKKPVTPGIIRKSTEIFDNVALLGGLMSGMVISARISSRLLTWKHLEIRVIDALSLLVSQFHNPISYRGMLGFRQVKNVSHT
ncbi:hypothetical protein CMUS01_07504 [Colletotrichum musicola]|uniref:Uncharacterized protein n=1 Tax=Colletotrichum musicola TaxID=2175873 RepID=A0A8H6KGR9_9PEZI|nr:hypothetical protein CMUS01_07504 [Colletotrichum musicola]